MGMAYIYLRSEDMKKLDDGENVEIRLSQNFMKNADTLIIRAIQKDKEPEAPETPDKWEQIKGLIDDAMAKRDRSVSLYFNPDTGMSVSVYPWPDVEDMYEQYKKGLITENDLREKMGLPRIKTNRNARSYRVSEIPNTDDWK